MLAESVWCEFFLLWCNKSVVVNGFDHILKLDFGGPGPTVVNDWLPGSFPAVHWRQMKIMCLKRRALHPVLVGGSTSKNKNTDIRHSGIRDAELVRKLLWMIHYEADLQSGI